MQFTSCLPPRPPPLRVLRGVLLPLFFCCSDCLSASVTPWCAVAVPVLFLSGADNSSSLGQSPPLEMESATHDRAFGPRRVFWAGAVAVVAGVLLPLPMYVAARATGYRMVGMPVDFM